MSKIPFILAVDGGGTSTTTWLTDDQGHVLGKGGSGPSNIKAVGPNASMTALDMSILLAFKAAGIEPSPVKMSCFGLAGFDRPEDKAWLQAWADDSVWADRLLFVNDGDLVVAAGTPGGVGVGVIAGTGSIAVGRTSDGRTARAGGWGYLFGDEGSGFSVAVEGLRRVARRADGRELSTMSPDPLTEHVLEALGIERTASLVTNIYSGGFNRARIAGLAAAVVAASEQDPTIVTEILEPAGRELAQMVKAVARKLDWADGHLNLAVAGSFVLMTPFVYHAMLNELSNQGYVVNFQLVLEPVTGAVELAKKALLT